LNHLHGCFLDVQMEVTSERLDGVMLMVGD